MRRDLGKLLGRASLHDLSGVHDQDLVREVAGRGDVVGDIEHREAEAPAEVVEQVQHLQADRDVEHRHWLVGEQHARAGGQRTGEGDPLALAAGQLMRVLGQELLGGREPDLLHQADDLMADLCVLALMKLDRPFEVIAHGMYRVERGERVLEHELDLALVPAEVPTAGHLHLLAVQPDRAGGEPFLPGQEPGRGGLARTALTDERDDSAAVQVKGDIAHGMQRVTAADPEVLAERDRLHGERPACLGRGRQGLFAHVPSSPAGRPEAEDGTGGGTGVSGSTNGQAVTWSGSGDVATGNSRMSTSWHSGLAYPQRGTNGQPGGGLPRSGGEPGMPASSRRGPRSDGNELSRPLV